MEHPQKKEFPKREESMTMLRREQLMERNEEKK